MLNGPVLYLVMGIAIGVILTAKSVKDMVTGLPEGVVPYAMFGFLLFGATAALGWPGFTCAVVAFVFYHVVGADGLSQGVRSFFSFKWLRRKKKTPEQEAFDDTVAAAERQPVSEPDSPDLPQT